MLRTWQGSATREPAFLMNCRRRSLLVGVAAVPSRRGAGPKCRDLQPTHRARVKARLLGHELSWSPADAKRQGTTVAPCRICRRETLVGKDTLPRILRRGRADPLQVAPRRARKRRPAVMGRPGLAHRDILKKEARGERRTALARCGSYLQGSGRATAIPSSPQRRARSHRPRPGSRPQRHGRRSGVPAPPGWLSRTLRGCCPAVVGIAQCCWFAARSGPPCGPGA
jgi:hypothetical protein